MNALRQTLINKLDQRAVEACESYKRSEAALISILQEMDEEKAYLDLQFKSLFDYATSRLRLSKDIAYIFITLARKSKEVPALKQAIERHEISVSNARRIAPILNLKNKEEWIEKAKTLNMDALEQELATAFPKQPLPEKIKPLTQDRVVLSITISHATLEKLKRAQDLLSQKSKQAVTLEGTIDALLNTSLEKTDPVKRAKRLVVRRVTKPSPLKAKTSEKTRSLIPKHTLHQVHLRDLGQCTHLENGQRCKETRWIHIHHKIPVSHGGQNELDNLTTLCSGHHRLEHRV